jgi:hypothetical protein
MTILYLAADSVCKSLFDIQSIFKSRRSTGKQIDVAGVSTVSFTVSFPQMLQSLQRSNLPTEPFFKSYAVRCVSYQSLSRT